MKFIGALGLASAREKRPAAEVAEGGKGCCGYTCVRTVELRGICACVFACACTEGSTLMKALTGAGGFEGNRGRSGCIVVACKRRETKCG